MSARALPLLLVAGLLCGCGAGRGPASSSDGSELPRSAAAADPRGDVVVMHRPRGAPLDLLGVRYSVRKGPSGPRLDVDLVVNRWYGGGSLQHSRGMYTVHLDDTRGRPRYVLTHRGTGTQWLRDVRTGAWTSLHTLSYAETSRPHRQTVFFFVRMARLPALEGGLRVRATVTLRDPRTGVVQTVDRSARGAVVGTS